MTIGGLVYGPTLGAPRISPWANVSVGFGGPTFLSSIAPFTLQRQAQWAVDYWGAAYALPAVGSGDALADATTDVPAVGPYTESEEICWRNADTGQEACFLSGSIFQPGGVWGPAGNWFPTSSTHPPPIDPEYLPTRRVEEPAAPEVPIVPLHEDAGWVSGLLGAATNLFGGVAGISPVPGFAPTGVGDAGVVNGAAMPGYAGSCPPRKTRTLTIDCATGQEVKRTRRRRRRLLTSSDLGDLAQLQALVGKGSNAMAVAVSKAIR